MKIDKRKLVHYSFEILISAIKYESINTDHYQSAFNTPLEFITRNIVSLPCKTNIHCINIDCSMEIALRHVKKVLLCFLIKI